MWISVAFKHFDIFKRQGCTDLLVITQEAHRNARKGAQLLKVCDSYQASFSSKMARLPNFAEMSAAGVGFGCPDHPVFSSHSVFSREAQSSEE